jgi:hypothetical protein
MQVLDARHGNPETASVEFDVEMSEVKADDADGGPFGQTLRQLGAVETAPDLRHFADVIDSSPIDVHAPSLSRPLGHRLSVPRSSFVSAGGHKEARRGTKRHKMSLAFNYCASLCLLVAILLVHLTDSEFFSASHVAAIGFAGRIDFFRGAVLKLVHSSGTLRILSVNKPMSENEKLSVVIGRLRLFTRCSQRDFSE